MHNPLVYVLAHNIRSLYNVGSIFRTADGAKIQKIFLTGYTGTPPRREISKTAIGADNFIPWEYQSDPIKIIKNLKKKGVTIVALEQTKKSVDYRNFVPSFPLCLIIGHEVLGIDQKILALADHCIEIPMYGKKASLNVAVAFGICAYKLRE